MTERKQLGRSKKDPYPFHIGNFCHPEGEGESSKEYLKFVQDVWRVGGGSINFLLGGVLLISSMGGGMDPFWNNPL